MMRRFKTVLSAHVALTAFAAPALAQPAPPPAADTSSTSDPEIIVTAQKRAQRLIDVPQSVSVVSADVLRQTHSDRFSDFFTRIPSAAVNSSQAGLTRLILRGINTGGVGATVATYVDETPFGSATSLANGAILTPDLDPSDIDRVEVLRGPQGTLYGANSLGGLLKYVTTLPSTDAFHLSAEGNVESVDHGNTGWSARAATNVPLGQTLAVRASGFYRRDPGFIDSPRFGSDINDGKTYGGRGSILFKPTDALTLRGTVTLENINSNGADARDVDPLTLKPVAGRFDQFRIVREPSNFKYRVYNGTGTYDFGGVTLLSSTSWGNLDQNGIIDDSAIYTPILTPVFGEFGYSQVQQVRQRRFTEEVRLSSSGKSRFEWTIGGFYTHERNLIHQIVNGVDLGTGDPVASLANLATVDLASRYREYAGFANGTFHITPKFDLTFGGRYSHNKQRATQNNDGPLVGGASQFDANSKDHVFTYSVAPSFKPNENTTIYARVARGYRPGGPNVLPPLAPPTVPRQFGPDTTTNYELGIKSDLLDRKLSLELTGFYIDWRKIQLITVVDNFGVNINGGSARSKGIEFAATLRPVTGLSLSANGAYVDAYLTQDAPTLVGGLKGDHLPYTARFSGTLAADYERPLSGTVNGTAGISWRFTGHRQSAFDTTYGQRRLGSFNQVDAHAGVTFDRFRLDAFVRNLTDSRGILDLGPAGSAQNGAIAASIVRPRSIGLTLGVRY